MLLLSLWTVRCSTRLSMMSFFGRNVGGIIGSVISGFFFFLEGERESNGVKVSDRQGFFLAWISFISNLEIECLGDGVVVPTLIGTKLQSYPNYIPC